MAREMPALLCFTLPVYDLQYEPRSSRESEAEAMLDDVRYQAWRRLEVGFPANKGSVQQLNVSFQETSMVMIENSVE